MFDPVPLYRVSRWLYQHRVPWLPSALQRINYFFTGCDLPPTAIIGRRPRFMHHGAGIMIHNKAAIGDDVLIMPHVVIGQNVRRGTAVPLQLIRIGDRVTLGAGAKIIASGELSIGDDASVGANAVVLRSVPPGRTAVGVPARLLESAASAQTDS